MADPVDPLSAVRSFLLADTAIAAIVDDRVYGGELPRSENDAMPRTAVVVKPAGGGLLGQSNGFSDKRVDVICYGATLHESSQLYLNVRAALKNLRRVVSEDVLLHWARLSSDGATGRDPEKDWPVTLSSWQILASDS